MIEKHEIIQFLEENDLDYIEILKEEKGILILSLSYKFDNVEKEAAQAFADEECKSNDKDEWNYDFYLPYLNDIAVDNITDILEECTEDKNINYQFIAYDVPMDNVEYNDFLISFTEGEIEINLEDYLMEIM